MKSDQRSPRIDRPVAGQKQTAGESAGVEVRNEAAKLFRGDHPGREPICGGDTRFLAQFAEAAFVPGDLEAADLHKGRLVPRQLFEQVGSGAGKRGHQRRA